MDPDADWAACAAPSRAEGYKENTDKHIQGQLRLQCPFRVMTPRTSSVACVDPCGKAIAVVSTCAAEIEVEEQDALTRPTCTSGKSTAVVGNYTGKT